MTERNDAQKARIVDAAVRLIEADPASGDSAARFAKALFARGAAEDIVVYSPAELASTAIDSYRQIASRVAGTSHVRVYNPTAVQGSGQLGDVTIVEIVNDNMPFLVDSTMGELQETGLDLRLVLHPILWVARDGEGRLTEVYGNDQPAHDKSAIRESVIVFHVSRIDSISERHGLEERLQAVLSDTRLAVRDWRSMRQRLESAVRAYKDNPPPLPVDEIAEAIQFGDWLLDDNFTFLGMREYDFVDNAEGGELARTDEIGLGILSDPDVRVLRRGREFVVSTPELLEFLKRPEPLIVTKANVRSRVHRRAHMDYVGVKLYDENGTLTGELRVIGLFSATAYTRSTARIPLLRRKIGLVMERAGYDIDSHSGRVLLNVLESYPRDELFQLDIETLYRFAMAVMQLAERPRIRVLARIDRFDRFVSILVYVPRERYNTNARIRIGNYFADVFKGRVSAWYVAYPEGPLARVHFIIGRYEGKTPVIAQDVLEAGVGEIVRTWADRFKSALDGLHDTTRARLLLGRYGDAFTQAYREAFDGEAGVGDALTIEKLSQTSPIAIHLRERDATGDGRLDLKIYHLGEPIPLSDRVPILERMGLKAINERTYKVERRDAPQVFLHDVSLQRADGGTLDLTTDKARIEEAFMAVWRDQAENDAFNALVVAAELEWRDVAMLRALARYLRQARFGYSQDYIAETLVRNARISAALVELFTARFNPAHSDSERFDLAEEIVAAIQMDLEEVTSLDDDTILRRYLNLFDAMLRTNFFQPGSDGAPKPTFAFKFDSSRITDLPSPHPLREIFVYSPRVEGVHLRYGMIARGGLRWSDRPQDFRTEVLGLAKAQQVKNAVIVPFGAKGGFVPKRLPGRENRDAWMAEGIAAYKIFVSSLLDVSDNLGLDGIIAPDEVVRRDGDDPYLVVAADKGTATFSDIANGISQGRGFWLDDAFASGGSAGYDHKKMGITARGGWEAVKRHFREMNIDIQATPFTAVGVGDMSGDVFGNGMLLSEQTKLIAAFDHRDIFLDPNPDPAISFAERKRMFDLPRSSWADYDREKISAGGGVFSRSLKSIPLSAQVRAVLGVTAETMTPNELMRAILKAPADLLWFGGIGTYVRATTETDEQVGDKASDALRITARDIRARVVGEGANLGLTQKARIEFDLAGGHINTDAIDNSAGVNSSDMEVNIKIALGAAERAGKLNREDRNTLLASMTDDVASLVLRNNYLQTLSLSLTRLRGRDDTGYQRRLMATLETRGLLERGVEFLPDEETIDAREAAGKSLTRPELAVLLAYAKNTLFSDLLKTDVPDDEYLGRELFRYFPKGMHEGFSDEIVNHQLRREIIATQLANSIINRGGATLIQRVSDTTGAAVDAIARAFAAVRDSYGLTALNEDIDALDTRIDGALQLELYAAIQDLVTDRIAWFLTNATLSDGLSGIVTRYRKGLDDFRPVIAETLLDPVRSRLAATRERYIAGGVPEALAETIAHLPVLSLVPDMVKVEDETGATPLEVASAYFRVGAEFKLGRIDSLARELDVADYYDALALDRARQTLALARRRMTGAILATDGGFEAWTRALGHDLTRTIGQVTDIVERGDLTVSRIAVAAGLLADLSN